MTTDTDFATRYEADCEARRQAAAAFVSGHLWLAIDCDITISWHGRLKLAVRDRNPLPVVGALDARRAGDEDQVASGRRYTVWETVCDGVEIRVVHVEDVSS